MLRFKSLGSGSAGNATLVEAHSSGSTITRLLVDCGLGIRELDTRLAQAGLTADLVSAVFVTHEHADHIGCARQFALREKKPVWMSAGTLSALEQRDFGGFLRTALDGQSIDLGELLITPFTVPHDAREPLQLACTDGSQKLAMLTDLGHVSSHVISQLKDCTALLLECNHDVEMLARSRYPDFLKRRVGGQMGHLSNTQAADLVGKLRNGSLKCLVAAHLSEQNNHPELAQLALSEALGWSASDILVATQGGGTRWMVA